MDIVSIRIMIGIIWLYAFVAVDFSPTPAPAASDISVKATQHHSQAAEAPRISL